MISIDHSAYYSRLRKVDPVIKIITALVALFISLFANSYLVSTAIIIVLSYTIVKFGGTSFHILLKLMMLPISFLILSIVTILFQSSDNPNNLLLPIKISYLYYGFYIYNLDLVGRLIFRAISAILCMYFIALTSPMIEIFCVLRRVKFLKLVVELMELIYRFIFVLNETANKIYIAQSSRLGYNGLKASYKSLGILASMLFDRSYKRSDKIYVALESRGYNGELNVIYMEYDKSFKYYIFSGIFIAILVIISSLERFVA